MLSGFSQVSKFLPKSSSLISSTKSLHDVNSCSIVYRYQKKRSIFDKTSYVDYWIPPQVKYHYKRKPRLSEWDDPNVVWPPRMPRANKLQGKALIKELEDEEMSRMKQLKSFRYPDFRTGDVIEFHNLHSLSEGRGNTYQGIVLGRKRRNSWSASFAVYFKFCGYDVKMRLPCYSPLVSQFRIVHKGSGNFKNNIDYVFRRAIMREQLTRPMIKKSVSKRYDEEKIQTEKIKKTKIKMDSIDTNIY